MIHCAHCKQPFYPARADREIKYCTTACFRTRKRPLWQQQNDLVSLLEDRDRVEFYFWPKVNKTDACWLWTGCKDINGYGKITTKIPERLKITLRADRLAFALYHGAFDLSLDVLHTCDTPACVRAEHLYLGTPQENSRDAVRRGRAKSGTIKLRIEQVKEIRALHVSGVSQTKLAALFSVSNSLISLVVNNKIWKKC